MCLLPCGSTAILTDNVMTTFITSNRTDARKTDVNLLRVNVTKNQRKFQKCGHGQKIDFAQTLSV